MPTSFFVSFCPVLKLSLRGQWGCGWLRTSSICVDAWRVAKTLAQNTGTLSAHSRESYSCVTRCLWWKQWSAGEPAEWATARGCCLPSPDREIRRIFFWLHKKENRNTGSLPDWHSSFPLTGTIQAVDWNAFCNFLHGKRRAAVIQCAYILQQQMKMDHLRRMLPFFPDEDCRNSSMNGMLASMVLFSQSLVSFEFLTFRGSRSGQRELDKENACFLYSISIKAFGLMKSENLQVRTGSWEGREAVAVPQTKPCCRKSGGELASLITEFFRHENKVRSIGDAINCNSSRY